MKWHHFENGNFFKILYGERARLAYSAHLPYNTLIKIAIFTMMVLWDTLVYDSGNWSAYQPFPVVSLFLCFGSSFIGAVISIRDMNKFYKTRASKKITGLNEEKVVELGC